MHGCLRQSGTGAPMDESGIKNNMKKRRIGFLGKLILFVLFADNLLRQQKTDVINFVVINVNRHIEER